MYRRARDPDKPRALSSRRCLMAGLSFGTIGTGGKKRTCLCLFDPYTGVIAVVVHTIFDVFLSSVAFLALGCPAGVPVEPKGRKSHQKGGHSHLRLTLLGARGRLFRSRFLIFFGRPLVQALDALWA